MYTTLKWETFLERHWNLLVVVFTTSSSYVASANKSSHPVALILTLDSPIVIIPNIDIVLYEELEQTWSSVVGIIVAGVGVAQFGVFSERKDPQHTIFFAQRSIVVVLRAFCFGELLMKVRFLSESLISKSLLSGRFQRASFGRGFREPAFGEVSESFRRACFGRGFRELALGEVTQLFLSQKIAICALWVSVALPGCS